MAATRRKSPVTRNADAQRSESLFASRSRLQARLGPPIFEAAAARAGMVFLLRRFDLMAMVKRGHWPKPIAMQVSKLIMDGLKTPGTQEDGERLADMCHALVLASAIVPPPEVEALGGAPIGEPDMPIYPGTPPDVLEMKLAENARRSEEREAATAAWRAEVRKALKAADPESLKPLFVERGEDPDEDQLVLVQHGDPVPADEDAGEIQLHINDLISLATAISQFQTGALSTFRE